MNQWGVGCPPCMPPPPVLNPVSTFITFSDVVQIRYRLKCRADLLSLSPSPLGAGSDPGLDGLYLPADLLRGEAVQRALPSNHQEGEERRQAQHGAFKLPEQVLLHQAGAAARGGGGNQQVTDRKQQTDRLIKD